MGYPKSDGEKEYLDAKLGARWQRTLGNGQILNWFADFCAHEAKMDRDKIVKRLRVFASRDEAPTTFWAMLLTKFYEEGAHLGLRKYCAEGVTYYCPPQFFEEFKNLCESTPTYKNTLTWIFQPDYLSSGHIFAHVLAPGVRDWFKRSWPDALRLRGRRYLVSYYRAGSVYEIADAENDDDIEETTESYRNCHSLLCLIFKTTSPAAYDINVGRYGKERILEILDDPFLASSNPALTTLHSMSQVWL